MDENNQILADLRSAQQDYESALENWKKIASTWRAEVWRRGDAIRAALVEVDLTEEAMFKQEEDAREALEEAWTGLGRIYDILVAALPPDDSEGE